MLPFSGYWTDNYGQRFVLLGTDALKSTLSCVMFITSLFFFDSMGVIVLGIFGAVISLGNGQTMLAAETCVSSNFKGMQLSKEQAKLFKIDQIAMVIGPFIAVMVLFLYKLNYFFIAASLLYATNFLLVLTIKSHSRVLNNNARYNVFGSIAIGLSILKKYPILLLFCALAIGNNLISGIIEIVSAGVVTSKFGESQQAFAFISMATGIAGVIALTVLPRLLQVLSRKSVFMISLPIMVLCAILLSKTRGFTSFIVDNW